MAFRCRPVFLWSLVSTFYRQTLQNIFKNYQRFLLVALSFISYFFTPLLLDDELQGLL